MEAISYKQASHTEKIKYIVDERLARSPKSIRKKISKEIPSGNYFVVSYSVANVVVTLILSKKHKKDVLARINKNMEPVPGLVVPANVGSPALFALENTYNSIISNVSLEGGYAFSVGSNCRVILDKVEISVADSNSKYTTTVELGFIVSGKDGKAVFAIDEAISDLVTYFISKMRDLK